MRRWLVVAMVGGWSLACLSSGHHDDETEPVEPGPDGTDLAVYWDGDLDCPSGEQASLGFRLNDGGGEALIGDAVLIYGSAPRAEDVVYQTLSVGLDDEEAEVSGLLVEGTDCTDHDGDPMDCPAYLGVVWDRQELPAFVAGEIPDREDPDAHCTFVLHPRS